MPFRFDRLALDHPDLAGDGTALRDRIATLHRVQAPRLRRLWAYYRNPMSAAAAQDANGSGRPYRQAQEWGLPPRITGRGASIDVSRKEVVIENDIGWRVDAMVDFLFGQPIVVNSAAADPTRRTQIERLLRQILSHNGGVSFLQKLALLGSVYGYVDVLVKYVPDHDASANDADVAAGPACDTQLLGEPPAAAEQTSDTCDETEPLARLIRLEIVEPTRALPIHDPLNEATPVAYAQHYLKPCAAAAGARRSIAWMDALKQMLLRTPQAGGASPSPLSSAQTSVLEIISPARWQRYEDEQLVAEGENSLGRVPLVHVQNVAVPFAYEGAGDVEPLIPLQDELNTRLSDRAYRITMQSFKMYLGKGLDDFINLPIGPGRMYATDNPDAQIIEFGGDSACPSEQAHVDEIREALDKTSGVSPIAAGAIKGRIGRLSSAAALRVTLLALLGRTERKRTTYGPAIAQMCELALAWLDRAGHFATTPAERRVAIHWPSPIPANKQEDIDAAQSKADLGVDPAQVVRELGY